MEQTRRFPRAKVGADIEVWVQQDKTLACVVGRLAVVGGGGALVELAAEYPVGAQLGLWFELPPSTHEIGCTAVVRYQLEGGGVGVEFLEVAPGERERIGEFVRQQLADQASEGS